MGSLENIPQNAAPTLPGTNELRQTLSELAGESMTQDHLRELALRTRVEGSRFFAKPVVDEDPAAFEARRAEALIGQIPYIAQIEQRSGRDFGMLVTITESDYKSPAGINLVAGYLQPEWLVGATRQVWDYAVQNGLNPTLESWDDIRFKWAGHVIVLHFPGGAEKCAGEELGARVIGEIPVRAAFAAHCGRTWAEVMSLHPERDFNEVGRNIVERPQLHFLFHKQPADYLAGPALEVFKYAQARDLMPALQAWQSPDGNAGYSIVIHWPRIKSAGVDEKANTSS